jgi:hypothetical protein
LRTFSTGHPSTSLNSSTPIGGSGSLVCPPSMRRTMGIDSNCHRWRRHASAVRGARMLARLGRTRSFLDGLLARQNPKLRRVIPAELWYRDARRGSRELPQIARSTTVQMGLQLHIHYLRQLERRSDFAPVSMRLPRDAPPDRFGTCLTRLVEKVRQRDPHANATEIPARSDFAATPAAGTAGAIETRVERSVRRVEMVARQQREKPSASDNRTRDAQTPTPRALSTRGPTVIPSLRDRRRTEEQLPLSTTELSRLTEQVIQTIDRRFVAYRERCGG